MTEPLIFPNLLNIAAHPDQVTWEKFGAGTDIYRIYDNGTSSAALIRYAPGAKVPQHQHTGFEHIIVLAGSQTDLNGEHKSGTLVINPPDSSHSVHSENGCIVLVIWEKPNIWL
ncbi:MAG: cupin domain-containing protein [Pseudanabaenaceae cyanobacterium]|jgi:anti-sigma factor ChrR (cupin superfamily)